MSTTTTQSPSATPTLSATGLLEVVKLIVNAFNATKSHEEIVLLIQEFVELFKKADAEEITGIPPVPEATEAASLVGHVRDQPAVTRNPLILRAIAQLTEYVVAQLACYTPELDDKKKYFEETLFKFTFYDSETGCDWKVVKLLVEQHPYTARKPLWHKGEYMIHFTLTCTTSLGRVRAVKVPLEDTFISLRHGKESQPQFCTNALGELTNALFVSFWLETPSDPLSIAMGTSYVTRIDKPANSFSLFNALMGYLIQQEKAYDPERLGKLKDSLLKWYEEVTTTHTIWAISTDCGYVAPHVGM